MSSQQEHAISAVYGPGPALSPTAVAKPPSYGTSSAVTPGTDSFDYYVTGMRLRT